MNKVLYQKEEAKQFYENRYEGDYMDEWPIEKKQRIFNIIQNLDLPESGNAIDFGCGNGVFTEVIRQALPKWKIYGCDISQNAIENAKNRFPECTFFVSDNDRSVDLQFDFLFSHHVLEHVFDIKKTTKEIADLLSPKSFTLHIFPCGNEDSLEHKVCKMLSGGINKEMENRFYFEDEGHVRRLTTEQTNLLMKEFGFTLENDFYSNQYYGAIKWITQSSPKFVMKFINPKTAIDKMAYKYLSILRFKLILLHILQLPAIVFNMIKVVRNKNLKHYLILIIDFIPFLISYPIYAIVNYRAKQEWESSKRLKNGSEMYLFYGRKN
ncbi:MAG: trans-aconitate methyltransferase [Lentimonas sp.]|jgi:trans-aconitate methyltransferase